MEHYDYIWEAADKSEGPQQRVTPSWFTYQEGSQPVSLGIHQGQK